MRDSFRGWHGLSASDADELWRNGLIVTDTNVLLDLYRLTPESRKSLLSALQSVQGRLWIPHQVGLEFHKSRDQVRGDTRKSHAELAQRLSTDTRKLIKLVAELRVFNPAIDSNESLRKAFGSSADSLGAELKTAMTEYDEAGDVVLDELDRLFPEARIGRPFRAEREETERREALRRIEFKVPPGFADNGKAGDLRFGDYFLWRQLMDRSIAMQTGAIFITRDEKEDWRKGGRVLPDLAYEFEQVTGSLVHVMHPDTFIRESVERGLWTPEDNDDVDSVVEDYERVSRADAEAAQAILEAEAANNWWVSPSLQRLNARDDDPLVQRGITYDQLRKLGSAMASMSEYQRQILKREDEPDEGESDGERAS